MTAHADPPFDLFICHATADGAVVAQALARDLEQRGARCWIAPRDIPPGMSWPAAIVAGIEGSVAMLLVVSAKAGASPEIEKEVTLAAHLRKPILPVRLADVQLSGSLLYHLQSRQWRDLFADRERVLDEIAAQAAALRGRAPALEPPRPAAPDAARPKRRLGWYAAGSLMAAVAVAAAAYAIMSGGKAARDVSALTVAILADGLFSCTGVAVAPRTILTTDYCIVPRKAYSIRFGGARDARTYAVTDTVEQTAETGNTLLTVADPDGTAPVPASDMRVRAPRAGEPVAVLTFADRWSTNLKRVDADCGVIAPDYVPNGTRTDWRFPRSLFRYHCATPQGTAGAPIVSTAGDLLGIVYGSNADGVDVGRSIVAIVAASPTLKPRFAAADGVPARP